MTECVSKLIVDFQIICQLMIKNCRLSIVLTAMDQKQQKSSRSLNVNVMLSNITFLRFLLFLIHGCNTIDKLQFYHLYLLLLSVTVHFIALRLRKTIMHHHTLSLHK